MTNSWDLFPSSFPNYAVQVAVSLDGQWLKDVDFGAEWLCRRLLTTYLMPIRAVLLGVPRLITDFDIFIGILFLFEAQSTTFHFTNV